MSTEHRVRVLRTGLDTVTLEIPAYLTDQLRYNDTITVVIPEGTR